jgi:hypothetical protein
MHQTANVQESSITILTTAATHLYDVRRSCLRSTDAIAMIL